MNAKESQLILENDDLKKALAQVDAVLDKTIAEKEELNQRYDDFRGHYEQIKSQLAQYQKRLGEEIQQRKDTEINLESRLAEQRRLLDMKQREMDQMAQKLQLPIDTDILRMKIQKDLEARHRIEVEQKIQECERLQDQHFEAKRQLDIVRTQLESYKYESEKELQDSRERYKTEVQELMMENQALTSKADDRRDRDLIKQLRRDLDEARRKSQDVVQELNEMRRERDTLKLDKNDQFLSHQKELEELKNKNRDLQSEIDRIEFKSKSLVDENQKMQLKMEKRSNEVHQAHTEKVQLENILKSKDQIIDTLNRQINQLREDLKGKDLEQETIMRRKHEEDRQRELQDKNENIKLQHDVEYVKKQKLELESQLRTEIQKWRGDAEVAERKLRSVQDELKSNQNKLKQLQTDYDNLQRSIALKQTHMQQIDGEFTTIQEKYQKTENEALLLQKQKEQLEESIKQQTAEMEKFQIEYEDQLAVWKKDKSDMQMKIQELAAYSDKLKIDSQEQVENYKRKYTDYKHKLKKANTNIQTLTTRLAKYELQIQAEREIGRVDSVRKLPGGGSNFLGNDPMAVIHGHKISGNIGVKSAGSALSPGAIGGVGNPYDNFNIGDYNNDFENHELNEEIKKLLLENQIQM